MKLLNFVPSQRITALQALDHPFFDEIKRKLIKKAALKTKTTLIGQKRPKCEDAVDREMPVVKRRKVEPKKSKQPKKKI